MLTLPGLTNTPTFDAQAARDEQDWNALIALAEGQGVLSGCLVSAQTSPNMTVKVASGIVIINGTTYSVSAVSSVTINAASTTDRKDIIVYTVGTGVQCIEGTPNPAGGAGWSRTSTVLAPVSPAIPANSVYLGQVYVEGTGATATTSIVAGNIIDKTAILGAGDWVQTNPESATHAYIYPVSPDRVLIDPTQSLTDDGVSIVQTMGVSGTNPAFTANWDNGDTISFASDYIAVVGGNAPVITPYSNGVGNAAMAQFGGLFLIESIAHGSFGPYLYFTDNDASYVAFFLLDVDTGDLNYTDPTTNNTFAIMNSASGNIVQINDPTPDGYSVLQTQGVINVGMDPATGDCYVRIAEDYGVQNAPLPVLWRGGFQGSVVPGSGATFPAGSVGVDLTPGAPQIAVAATDGSIGYINTTPKPPGDVLRVLQHLYR